MIVSSGSIELAGESQKLQNRRRHNHKNSIALQWIWLTPAAGDAVGGAHGQEFVSTNFSVGRSLGAAGPADSDLRANRLTPICDDGNGQAVIVRVLGGQWGEGGGVETRPNP